MRGNSLALVGVPLLRRASHARGASGAHLDVALWDASGFLRHPAQEIRIAAGAETHSFHGWHKPRFDEVAATVGGDVSDADVTLK